MGTPHSHTLITLYVLIVYGYFSSALTHRKIMRDVCMSSIQMRHYDRLVLWINTKRWKVATFCHITIHFNFMYGNSVAVQVRPLTTKQTMAGDGICYPMLQLQSDYICFDGANKKPTKRYSEYKIKKYSLSVFYNMSGTIYGMFIFSRGPRFYPVATTTTTDATINDSDDGLGIGAIIGIVCACIVGFALLIWCCVKCCSDDDESNATNQTATNLPLAPIVDNGSTHTATRTSVVGVDTTSTNLVPQPSYPIAPPSGESNRDPYAPPSYESCMQQQSSAPLLPSAPLQE